MRREIEELIDEINDDVRFTCHETGILSIDATILDALRQVPREAFVPEALAQCAYVNRPLPVGAGQTISQPFIVALMTQMLQPGRDDTILEIGTGSGYQAAILARLAKHIVSLEIIPSLASSAADRLRTMSIDNVAVHCGDGYHGWPEASPYDGIIVTACAQTIPPALTEQLKAGGRMAIPLGEPYGYQLLHMVNKHRDGSIHSRAILPVAFVPLTRRPPPAPTRERET